MVRLLPTLLFLPGCSALFEQERTIVVTKSPYQIVLSGDVNFMDKMWATKTINRLSKEEYILHKFEPTNVSISGSETVSSINTSTIDENRHIENKNEEIE